MRLGDTANVFLGRVVRVFIGTLGAQLIQISSNVLLARLYSPSEMGIYSLWFGLLSVGGVVVTARYELAFFTVKHSAETHEIGKLVFMLASVLSILLGLGFLATVTYTDLLPPSISPFIVALVLGIFIFGLNNTLLSLLAFLRHFSMLGVSKITSAAAIAIVQVGAGILIYGASGLVYGHVIGSLLGLLLVLVLLDGTWKRGFRTATASQCKHVAKEYRSFPIYSLPADLLNNLARQLPIFIIVSRYGEDVGGWYGMTVKMMGAPVSLLATSILEVFKEQAARDYREKGNCRAIYVKTLPILAVLALPPFLLLYMYSEFLFVLVFGEQWRESGVYARFLVPMYYAAFVASPLSYVIYIAQKQRYDLAWQFGLLVVTALCFILSRDPNIAIIAFSWSYALMYLVYLLMSYHFSKGT